MDPQDPVAFMIICTSYVYLYLKKGGRRGRYRMIVGFTTKCAISAYHH
jgi:hypothetical protein